MFLDILRQRGNNYGEHKEQNAPNVLTFGFDLVLSGLSLPRPVNYGLVRIRPPAELRIDPKKRPFIVFDPRAGHGPGIGGMKHDSEIGVALAAGHPCYFVGFLPHPVPGQTVADVCRAEAVFVQEVAKLHPDAEGKPCLIANCQAGWQVIMMSAVEPDLAGPIMLAGTPLSYWNGVHGKNPLRYLGGLLGGTWLTSLAGDLGNQIFDGANLVANFEALNPANTYWEKSYNVFSKVDTEGPRFLEFENWWGSPTLLNANEMQTIADDLFVGNRLTSGEMSASDGARIDLRNIKSPIIVFCSFGDNITPPQQALGWILDLYQSEDDIVANGQTIIYALHQTIGHLGIFVSAKVATKEHQEFTGAMDLIDTLPPGLYEAVITEKTSDMPSAELLAGNYVMRFEPRTIAHIRALGGNDAEDDLRFATVARVSEVNQGLYRAYLSPVVQRMVNTQSAEWLRAIHPCRLRYEVFSDRNPMMQLIPSLVAPARDHRQPVQEDNLFLLAQSELSKQIVGLLERYQATRDGLIETWFMNVYGMRWLQALVGLQADAAIAKRRIGYDVAHRAAIAKAKEELEIHLRRGGLREAAIRALLYIGRARSDQGVDGRSFAVIRAIRARNSQGMSLSEFKDLVRHQYLLLRLDEEQAIGVIPALLPEDAPSRTAALDDIREIAFATGELEPKARERLAVIEVLFGSDSRQHERDTRDFRYQAASQAADATVSELASKQ